VKATPGSLLKCKDAATCQYVKFLQEENSIGNFIYQELDEVHLLVDSSKVDEILQKIDEFSDRNAYELDKAKDQAAAKAAKAKAKK